MEINIQPHIVSGFINNPLTNANEIDVVRFIKKTLDDNKIFLAIDRNENSIYYYEYDESYWKIILEEELEDEIYRSFADAFEKLADDRIKLFASDGKHKANLLFNLTKNKVKNWVQALLAFLPKMPEVGTPDYIPLFNGYIDLKTLDFKEPSKEIYNRYSIPFEYNENFEKPNLFLKFLEQLQPKESHRDFLLNWLSYLLVPSNPRQKALFMIGEGSNGKGVLVRLMEQILGKRNVSNVAITQLHYESNAITTMRNKMVNFAPDSDDKDQVHTGTFKALTGGDTIMVKQVYKDAFDFKFTGKLIFQVNKMPYFRTKDNAVLRRIEVLQFVNIVAEKDRIEDFEEKLLADGGSGIFMLLLNRARELAKIGFKFSAPQEIVEYSKMLVQDTDVIHNFFCDVLEVEDKNYDTLEFRKTKKEFYEDFVEYCKDNGFKVSNSATFKHDIVSYFKKREDWDIFDLKTSGVMNWKFVKTIPF